MRRRLTLTLLCVIAVAALFLVDYLSGPDVGFSLFYLIPVAMAAHYLGRGPGIALAAASAFFWLLADATTREIVSLGASVWNGFTRLVIFIAIVVLLDRQRAHADRASDLAKRHAEFMRVLEHELPRPVEAIAELAMKLEREAKTGTGAPATLRELQQRAQELRFLARDFVSLGLLQSERLTLSKRELDLNEAVREAVRNLSEKERVIVTLGADPPLVEADSDRLREAIESVVRSALQYSSEYVNVSVRSDAQSAWVDVSDRSRVPLRADDAVLLDDPHGAAGPRAAALADRVLGLRLAGLLMRAHGGSLDIESSSTLTSLVRLRLPRTTRPPLIRTATA